MLKTFLYLYFLILLNWFDLFRSMINSKGILFYFIKTVFLVEFLVNIFFCLVILILILLFFRILSLSSSPVFLGTASTLSYLRPTTTCINLATTTPVSSPSPIKCWLFNLMSEPIHVYVSLLDVFRFYDLRNFLFFRFRSSRLTSPFLFYCSL